MKKNMLMMLGALAFAFAGVNARAVEAVRGDITVLLEPTIAEKGDKIFSYLYINSAFKLGNDWSLVPELNLILGLKEMGEAKTSLEIYYLRMLLVGPTLASFGEGNDFALDYRYLVPIDKGSQQAGSMGALKIRPRLSWKFNDNFSALVRSGVAVYFQRNNYQIHNTTLSPAMPPAGNSLLGWDLEVMPTYKFTENVSVGALISPYVILKGAAKGSDETSLTKKMIHEYAVNINAAGMEFSPTVGHESDFSDFKLFTSQGLYYYLDIVKKF